METKGVRIITNDGRRIDMEGVSLTPEITDAYAGAYLDSMEESFSGEFVLKEPKAGSIELVNFHFAIFGPRLDRIPRTIIRKPGWI